MKNKHFDIYLGIFIMVMAVIIYMIDSSNFGVPLVLFLCGLVFILTPKKTNRKDSYHD
ncbi:hypothetical protein [Macrococcoides caseolyticum]|uniref:hypothetical protein n=1 Tax=Macrococcoides caseolyticum TaxID=69966 RepID=UPI001F27149D|nr:hypothetical protein [Macrococcus caseolyticus]MCE4956716.1 hypothetical protein [Macrococcus caseolyticus]